MTGQRDWETAIYVLVDRAGVTRYVGRTKYPARRVGDHLRRHPELTMRVVAYVPDHQAPGVELAGIKAALAAGTSLRNAVVYRAAPEVPPIRGWCTPMPVGSPELAAAIAQRPEWSDQ